MQAFSWRPCFWATFRKSDLMRKRAPNRRPAPLPGDCLPVLGQVVGRVPRERLARQGRIAGTTRPHHRSSENTQVRGLVRETPPVDDVGFRIVSHARAAVSMRGWPHRADWISNCRDSASGFVPLLHLVLDEGGEFALIVLVVGSDPADRKTQRVFHRRIEI